MSQNETRRRWGLQWVKEKLFKIMPINLPLSWLTRGGGDDEATNWLLGRLVGPAEKRRPAPSPGAQEDCVLYKLLKCDGALFIFSDWPSSWFVDIVCWRYQYYYYAIYL